VGVSADTSARALVEQRARRETPRRFASTSPWKFGVRIAGRGEGFNPVGLDDRKSLQDYFVDRKVARTDADRGDAGGRRNGIDCVGGGLELTGLFGLNRPRASRDNLKRRPGCGPPLTRGDSLRELDLKRLLFGMALVVIVVAHLEFLHEIQHVRNDHLQRVHAGGRLGPGSPGRDHRQEIAARIKDKRQVPTYDPAQFDGPRQQAD